MELWFRHYHGETCDPRWLGIAAAAGAPVTPGHVLAVWCALKECASKSKPRGRVDGFDTRAIADFFMWPSAQVEAIVAAIVARGMIADGVIVEWTDRQPVKKDATGAKRQREYRQRQREATARGDAEAPNVTHRNGVTNGVTPVTATEEKEQSKSSFSDALRQETNTSLKSDTPRTVRERAGAILDRGGLWRWLAAQGIPTHIGIRARQASRIGSWIDAGITDHDMQQALDRAQASRRAAHSSAPVNIGFLACFVDEVISGIPAKSNGGGYERGDQLSREFANG